MPTIFGDPTFEELDELIAAKDATIQAVTAERVNVIPSWGRRDPDAAATWDSEWDALRARYNAARALRVHAKPGSLTLPPEFIWHRVMRSIRQAWDTDGSLTQTPPESRGDLVDLTRRLGAEGGKPDFSGVPQPVARDPALEWFKAADVFTRLGAPTFAGIGILLVLFALARR